LNQFCPAPRHRASNNPAVQLTGGNPFYVTEVVQAGLGTVPSSARDAVLARRKIGGTMANAKRSQSGIRGVSA
jgi:hypothetical protein